MRLGVAQWRQESNTFNPVATTLADYERFGLTSSPDEIRARFGETDELGGFFQGLDDHPEDTILPLLRAVAWSGGPLEATAAAALRQALLEQVNSALPLDGLLLSLHGATVSADCDNLAAEVTEQVRQLVGPRCRLVVTLDLHANVSARLLQAADLVVGYQTTPHIDVFETGVRAARLLHRLLHEPVRPVTALRRLPVLFGLERQSTQSGPLAELAAELRAAEARGDCLVANLYPVQPWLDVPELASSVVVVTDGDAAAANRLADDYADRFWALRQQLGAARWLPERVAVKIAALERGPLVISDAADSTNSGAPGDSTVLLRAIIETGAPGPIYLSMVDPIAAEACHRAGVGCSLTLPLGGKRDRRTGPPVIATGVVRALNDGRYRVNGHGGHNVTMEAGPSAVFETGEVFVALSSHPCIGSHPKVYRSLGLDPALARAVVVKSPHGFLHDYHDLAAEVLWADCPGAACCDYTRLQFERVTQPPYPLIDPPHHALPAMLAQGLSPR